MYLAWVAGLWMLLFLIRHERNWIAGGIRELLTQIIIVSTLLFGMVFLFVVVKLKPNTRRAMIWGGLGVIPCLAATPFFSEGRKLSDTVETIELIHISWACDCADWATYADIEKYANETGDSLAFYSIYIEPANPTLELPDTLGYSGDRIRFTGQFYTKRKFPLNYIPLGNSEEARVFRYTKYEVIKSNYKNYKDLKYPQE